MPTTPIGAQRFAPSRSVEDFGTKIVATISVISCEDKHYRQAHFLTTQAWQPGQTFEVRNLMPNRGQVVMTTTSTADAAVRAVVHG